MGLHIPKYQTSSGSVKLECPTRKNSNGNFLIPSKAWVCALVCSTVIGIGLAPPARTQTLNDAYNNLLGGNCTGLSGGSTAGLGNDLAAICINPASFPSGSSSANGSGASSQTLTISVENRRKERLEEERKEVEILGNGWSLFVSGNVEALNRDQTTFADGFDSDIAGVTVGADKRITNQLLAGLAFTYTSTNGDFDGGGGFNTNSYGGIIYGSFLPAPGFFLDLAAGFARKDYTTSRQGTFVEEGVGGSVNCTPDCVFSGILNSDTDGNEISIRGLLGYDHQIANVTIGPRLGLNWTNTHIDDYSERDGGQATSFGGGAAGLALRYPDQWVNSLQSVVGLQGSMAISTGFGVLVPQVNADYIHEFANSQRFVTVQFVQDLRQNPSRFRFQNEKPVRNFFNLGLGLVAVLPHGIQPFVNFRAIVGNEQFNNYAGSFGVRVEM